MNAHYEDYPPGTFWQITKGEHTHHCYVDGAGKAWAVGGLYPMPIAWWNLSGWEARELKLVPAEQEVAL